LLQDRLTKGRERLDDALEAIALLCEPVAPPKGELEHIHYFCGNIELPADFAEHEPQRVALYKLTAGLVRAYANIADELEAAGYDSDDIAQIKRDLDRYLNLREIIRKASGETIDLKAYEADMRHLIDTYIEAAEPRTVSHFEGAGLLELIVKSGIADAINTLPEGIRGNPGAVAETITNNVRSRIIKEHLNDPAFYNKMSALLEEIIADLRARRIDYAEFLRRIAELAGKVQSGMVDETPERLRRSPALRALYNNLGHNETLAVQIDEEVKRTRPDGWRGVQAREQVIKAALYGILKDVAEVERIFLIIKQQTEY
jgi:type I restriction enzyme, R subunit